MLLLVAVLSALPIVLTEPVALTLTAIAFGVSKLVRK